MQPWRWKSRHGVGSILGMDSSVGIIRKSPQGVMLHRGSAQRSPLPFWLKRESYERSQARRWEGSTSRTSSRTAPEESEDPIEALIADEDQSEDTLTLEKIAGAVKSAAVEEDTGEADEDVSAMFERLRQEARKSDSEDN